MSTFSVILPELWTAISRIDKSISDSAYYHERYRAWSVHLYVCMYLHSRRPVS